MPSSTNEREDVGREMKSYAQTSDNLGLESYWRLIFFRKICPLRQLCYLINPEDCTRLVFCFHDKDEILLSNTYKKEPTLWPNYKKLSVVLDNLWLPVLNFQNSARDVWLLRDERVAFMVELKAFSALKATLHHTVNIFIWYFIYLWFRHEFIKFIWKVCNSG